MPDIEVRHCLVCEDIRQEILGKLSINGLFGIAPDINVNLQEINKSINSLVIGFYVSGSPGTYTTTFSLKQPSGELLVDNLPLADITISDNPDTKLLIGVELSGIVLPVVGDYVMELAVDGDIFYTTTLKVGISDPGLFTAPNAS
ncbi:MAG: hypothetical protein QM785_16730 [Pyrinomonadaceae bacterium]